MRSPCCWRSVASGWRPGRHRPERGAPRGRARARGRAPDGHRPPGPLPRHGARRRPRLAAARPLLPLRRARLAPPRPPGRSRWPSVSRLRRHRARPGGPAVGRLRPGLPGRRRGGPALVVVEDSGGTPDRYVAAAARTPRRCRRSSSSWAPTCSRRVRPAACSSRAAISKRCRSGTAARIALPSISFPSAPHLYATDSLYRRRMAAAMGVDPALPVQRALAAASASRTALPEPVDRQRRRARARLGAVPPGAGEPPGAARARRAQRRRAAQGQPRRTARPGCEDVRGVYEAAARYNVLLCGSLFSSSGTRRRPPAVRDHGGFRPLKRVLIANRGEIALRIVRACHEEGLEAVAVYSDGRPLEPARARGRSRRRRSAPRRPPQSYLDIERSIDAARSIGCRRRPSRLRLPGRAGGVRRGGRAARGSILVGPPPAAIRAMGDKTEARRRMQEAGVPIVPGASAPVDDLGPRARPGARGRLSGDGEGGGRRRREGDAGGADARGAARRARERGVARRSRRSATRASTSRSSSSGPRHVEIQVLADDSAPSISASASARSSAGTRSWSRRRRRSRSTPSSASGWAPPRSPPPRRWATAAREPASSCSPPTARSTSSR